MQRPDWAGVFPAITTPFRADGSVDAELFGQHAAWMVGHGCAAVVTPGSLGEGGLLTLDEKRALWCAAVEAVGEAGVRQLALERVGDALLDQRALVHGEARRLLQHQHVVVGEHHRDAEVERQRRVLGGERHRAAGAQTLLAVLGAHTVDGGGADRGEQARLLLRQRAQLGAVDALDQRIEAEAVLFGGDDERGQTRTPSSSSTKRWNR